MNSTTIELAAKAFYEEFHIGIHSWDDLPPGERYRYLRGARACIEAFILASHGHKPVYGD